MWNCAVFEWVVAWVVEWVVEQLLNGNIRIEMSWQGPSRKQPRTSSCHGEMVVQGRIHKTVYSGWQGYCPCPLKNTSHLVSIEKTERPFTFPTRIMHPHTPP